MTATANAANPQLGGPMKHVLVTLNGPTVGVAVQGDPLERMWLLDYGETYAPPANVLDGTHYNGQYGWVSGGFINLPPGAGIWVEVVAQSPGLETYEANTFTPILGTAGPGARWEWDGTMMHNWYAAVQCGKYQATYAVYVGDAQGDPLPGYTPAQIALYWQFVPDQDFGDADTDADVDLRDFASFQACFTGPGEFEMPSSCGCFDFDGDDDVDGADAEIALSAVTGPATTP